MNRQSPRNIHVSDETGNAFIAIADLLEIDRNELLEKLMTSYIESVREDMTGKSSRSPQFVTDYPFVQQV